MEEVNGTLEDWLYDKNIGVVWGYIYGDTKGRFPDGTHIHTSSIKPTGKLVEGFVVTTRNSSYKLGKPLKIN